MNAHQIATRLRGAGPVLLAILAVIMAVTYFAFSAPPRRSAPRRTRATARRPAAAHRPARHRRVRARKKAVARKRIGRLRPVVVGSTGTVVVKETGSSDVQVVPVEVPAETPAVEEAPSPGETMHDETKTTAEEPTTAGSANVPSDADESMADSPRYEVVGIEDNGLTIVVDVDGQETPVRMIGLAEPGNGNEDNDRPRRPRKRPGPGGRSGRPRRTGAPRLPTDIFLNNLLKGEEVYIVYDAMVEEQDEDGKYVAYVYRAPDGMLLNTEVIRQGLGVVDPGYDFAEKDTFLYYQDKARKGQKGLWAEPPHLNIPSVGR